VRAKARRRLERAALPFQPEPHGRVYRPRLAPHLWTITVQHRDGSKVILHSDELPDNRLTHFPLAHGPQDFNRDEILSPLGYLL